MLKMGPEPFGYEPLRRVRKDLRVEWYRCPIEHAKLRELMRPSDLQGWIQAGGHLGIAIIIGASVVYCFAHGMWIAFFLLYLFMVPSLLFLKGSPPTNWGMVPCLRQNGLTSSFSVSIA